MKIFLTIVFGAISITLIKLVFGIEITSDFIPQPLSTIITGVSYMLWGGVLRAYSRE